MLARCPRFASAFWTLTWVHCTSKENGYRVFLCPAVCDVPSNPGSPISSLLVVTADKPSSARQTRTTCSFNVWRTCAVASPSAFTDTWSCPSMCSAGTAPTQAKGRLEWATRPILLGGLYGSGVLHDYKLATTTTHYRGPSRDARTACQCCTTAAFVLKHHEILTFKMLALAWKNSCAG
jgi:hypothetical protein